MKTVIVGASVFLVSLLLTLVNLIWYADRVASWGGYFFAVGVVPVIVGFFVGWGGAIILTGRIEESIKLYWWLPVVGSGTALIIVAFIIWQMA